jgi:hypothetical protein
MTNIYCHILTPVNIQAGCQSFVLPVVYDGTVYIIRERNLQNTLEKINCLTEYLKFVKVYGYENAYKWLGKKGLLNEGFLESVCEYYIDNIGYKQIHSYRFFKKDAMGQPYIDDEYIKNICIKGIMYNFIKNNKDHFNEYVEQNLDVLESEFSTLDNENSRKNRQNHYKKNFFRTLIENYATEMDFDTERKIGDINNLNFSSASYVNKNELFIYKTGNINSYKECNFKLAGTTYKECIRGNSFIKLTATLNSRYSDENYVKSVLEETKEDLQVFADDKIEFGTTRLKIVMGYENGIQRKKTELSKYSAANENNSNVSLMQKTRAIISNTENHIISQYQSLKSHSNVYFAGEKELYTNIAVLNLDRLNLKRLNLLFKDKANSLESELLKFTFNNSNLPYSAYGFASINF